MNTWWFDMQIIKMKRTYRGWKDTLHQFLTRNELSEYVKRERIAFSERKEEAYNLLREYRLAKAIKDYTHSDLYREKLKNLDFIIDKDGSSLTFDYGSSKRK